MSAPGALELVRAFVNSLDLDRPEQDPFLTPESARVWLEERGFPALALAVGEAARLRELREALRMELLSHAGDDVPGAWDRLGTILDGSRLELAFHAGDGVALRAVAESGFETVRGEIAARVFEAVRADRWLRLKVCRKDTCLFAFYDRSKNGSGAWCDMAVCGNRVKAERRRARERTGARRQRTGSSD